MASEASNGASGDGNDAFSENFIRWAKLPPELGDIDLSPYLHLAASFASAPLIDVGLPERLRDIAANLLSSSRIEQKAVSDDDLRGLSAPDAASLVEHLGRMGRDRPGEMLRAVAGILRITDMVPSAAAQAEKSLRALPVKDIRAPVILLFDGQSAVRFVAVLTDWGARTTDQAVKNAVARIPKQSAG